MWSAAWCLVVTLNALALTIPITIQAGGLIGTWASNRIEDVYRWATKQDTLVATGADESDSIQK